MENRIPNTKCTICEKPIYRRPGEISKANGRAYCSRECYGIACRKPRVCPSCGKEFLSSKNSKTCSRSCANKMRLGSKYNGDNKRNKKKIRDVLKKKLIEEKGSCCESCGFTVTSILQVHHIVEKSKGGTDDIDNLRLLCPNCHCLIHYNGGVV